MKIKKGWLGLLLATILLCIYKLFLKTNPTNSSIMNGERHFRSPSFSPQTEDKVPTPLLHAQNSSGIMIESLSNEFVNMDELLQLLLMPWTKNQSNLVDLRKRMYGKKYNDTNLTELIFASKTNMKPGQKYRTVFHSHEGHLTGEQHNQLPKKSPFTKRFSSCSVVGSSGILVNTSCGRNIDQSDFVFRFNLPPIEKFIDDAGSKSNIITVNPSIISNRYKRLSTTASKKKFIEYLLQYRQSYFWFPAFHTSGSTRLSFNSARALSKDARVAHRSLFGRSDHSVAVAKFWNITAIRLSSGFYMANTALAMCDDVSVYGFWPFYTDHRNRDLQYHYFEPMKLQAKAHHFGDEFRILVDLHTKGVLKLNIDTCA